MAQKYKKTCVLRHNSHLLLTSTQLKREKMFKELYADLLQVLSRHNAVLDITTPNKTFVMQCTAACRKDIRRMFTKAVFKNRTGRTVELQGFTPKESLECLE